MDEAEEVVVEEEREEEEAKTTGCNDPLTSRHSTRWWKSSTCRTECVPACWADIEGSSWR